MILALDKAIKKEQRTLNTKTAIKYQNIYYKIYYIKYIAV